MHFPKEPVGLAANSCKALSDVSLSRRVSHAAFSWAAMEEMLWAAFSLPNHCLLTTVPQQHIAVGNAMGPFSK